MSGNLEISTVVGCRMRCSYCPQSSHIENYTERVGKNSENFKMSFEDFKFYLESVPKEVDIVFAGMAEPFLNPDAVKMIKYAFEKNHKISVYTTGFGINKEDIEILSSLSYHHFCLHVPDEEGDMNLKVTDKYIEILKDLKKIVNNVMCIGTANNKIKEIFGSIENSTPSLFSRAGNLKNFFIPIKTGKIFCSVCTDNLNHNVLLPNGDVLLCCMDYNQKHIIGNLKKNKYEEIFTTDEYLKVIKGLNDDSIDILCRKCEISKNI